MLPSKAELEKLAETYQKKSDRAFQNYQDTGAGRYQSEYQKNEDIADALRAAANVVEDRQHLGALRSSILMMASDADKAIAGEEPREKLEVILNKLISYAVLSCNYKRIERIKEAD